MNNMKKVHIQLEKHTHSLSYNAYKTSKPNLIHLKTVDVQPEIVYM